MPSLRPHEFIPSRLKFRFHLTRNKSFLGRELVIKWRAVIGCRLPGECSTDVTPAYDMKGFGTSADRNSDNFDGFDDVRIFIKLFSINC